MGSLITGKRARKNLLFGLVSLSLVAGPAARPAMAGFICVSDIDPPSTNNIDQSGVFQSATGAAGPTSILDLNTFRLQMSNAFPFDFGGVIDFEVRNDSVGNPVGSLDSPTQIIGRYGASAALASGFKSLTVTSGNGTWHWPGETSSGRTPISGVNSLGKDGSDIFDFDILIGAIANGLVNERVTSLGFAVLERSGTNLGSPVAVTASFSDGSTAVSTATISGAAPGSSEDAFFGFTAPTGTWITSVTFNPANFTTVDDLSFITSIIPEPSTLAAAATGACMLLGRHQRRRRRR